MTNSNQILPSEGTLKTNSTSTNVVNIRSGPVIKEDNVIHKGKSGDRVTILDKQKPSDDTRTWYKVQFEKQKSDVGWVREDVISVVATKPSPQPNPSEADTLVYFVTESKTVRVYGKEQAYINVYDNKSETTNSAPGAKLPKNETNNLWITYIASKDGYTYQARFIPGADTELTIIKENKVVLQQKGFRADGTEYRPK